MGSWYFCLLYILKSSISICSWCPLTSILIYVQYLSKLGHLSQKSKTKCKNKKKVKYGEHSSTQDLHFNSKSCIFRFEFFFVGCVGFFYFGTSDTTETRKGAFWHFWNLVKLNIFMKKKTFWNPFCIKRKSFEMWKRNLLKSLLGENFFWNPLCVKRKSFERYFVRKRDLLKSLLCVEEWEDCGDKKSFHPSMSSRCQRRVIKLYPLSLSFLYVL